MTYDLLERGLDIIKSLLQRIDDLKKSNPELKDKIDPIVQESLNLIDYLELNFKDENEWISWFVLSNNFGKNKLTAVCKGDSKEISSLKDLYYFCLTKNDDWND